MRKYFLPFVILTCLNLFAQEDDKTEFEIRGQIMSDMGYNFNQMNPDWSDVARPTQLPAFKNQYGTDGNIYYGVRQSNLDFRSYTPTSFGKLTTRFAFDLLGTGSDAGRTAFHMTYAYVELGKFSFGHNWNLFCDIDMFPNQLEYWGPVGMSLCRNVQIRYTPIDGENRLRIALEAPGASADQGIYRDRIELEDVVPKFKYPDLSADFRVTRKWGYAELAGVVRKIAWVDQGNQPFDLSGNAIGWGLHLSSNIKLTDKTTFLGEAIIGEGIQNVMNDAPTDIALKNDFADLNAPVKGVAIPVHSFTTYLNHQWNDKFSSIIGYSMIVVDNTDGQSPDAFHIGKYASTNLLYYPVPNMMAGIEYEWINRENFNDGWNVSASKIHFSLRYFFIQGIKKSKMAVLLDRFKAR